MWRDIWTKNQKGAVFAVGMICFLAAGLIVAGSPSPAKTQAKARVPIAADIVAIPEFDSEKDARNSAEPQSDWVLYVTGAVRRPGVYNLPPESRLLRLVEAAGGLTPSADPVAVNLAAVLSDGMHVHVPEKGEEPPARGAYAGISGSPASNRLIDVNRASAEELTALKGIGPALAGNIVDYRLKNGRFRSVDDLLQVNGIGRKKLEGFRDSVAVGP